MWVFLAVMLLPAQCMIPATTASVDVQPGCIETCGNITVPYPFGINEIDCAINRFFLLTCNSTYAPPQLFFGNIPVVNISVEDGTISVNIAAAFDCYNETGLISSFDQTINLGAGPFRFSDTRNKLTSYGCDTLAFMTDAGGNFGSGCVSLCSEPVNITEEGSCSGLGCCQTCIPKSLKTLNITIASPASHGNVWMFNPCGYAFIVDQSTFKVSKLGLSDYPDPDVSYDVAIEWVVREEICEDALARNEYACGSNSDCIYSQNGQGYRCLCKQGFAGNPYLRQGCQDIDECKEPEKFPCGGKCKNTYGNYTCSCPLGMHGDGKVGCEGFRVTTIVTVTGAIIFTVIIGLLTFIVFKRRIKEKNFIENGGMLLKHQRVRIFREEELEKATNNYDAGQFLGEGGFGSVYKGVLADGTQVAVKKPKELDKAQMNQEFQQEIGIVSQVNHRNVVKLLGLCLETKVPLLVYEFISNGTLYQLIHNKKSQVVLGTWKNRLRIAAEIALALDYLHSLADPPIIHGDIKSMNILLDDNYTAKVSDFGASVLISPGEIGIARKIRGTFGYLDPEYLMSGDLTEKSDVYSFGVVLVELLTGEKPTSSSLSGEKTNLVQYFISELDNRNLYHILDFNVANQGEMMEVETVAELVKTCLNLSGIKRPTMREVAEILARLKRMHENLLSEGGDESEHLLSESIDMVNATQNQFPVTITATGFDIYGHTESV